MNKVRFEQDKNAAGTVPASASAPAHAETAAIQAMRRAEALQRMLRAMNRLVSNRPDRAMEGWVQALLPVLLLKLAEYAQQSPLDMQTLVSSLETQDSAEPEQGGAGLDFGPPGKPGLHVPKHPADRNPIVPKSEGSTQLAAHDPYNGGAEKGNVDQALVATAARQIAALQAIFKVARASASSDHLPTGSHGLHLAGQDVWASETGEFPVADVPQIADPDRPDFSPISPVATDIPETPDVASVVERDQTFEPGPGDQVLDGGDGTDTISFRNNAKGIDFDLGMTTSQNTGDGRKLTVTNFENIIGSKHDDQLAGDDGDNTISGLSGNDVLEGGRGHNVLDGGDGKDTVSYRRAQEGVEVDLSVTREQQVAPDRFDRLVDIENIDGSPYDDILKGNAGDNALNGEDGNDALYGEDGNDRLNGGLGNDQLYGGSGDDTLSGGAGDDLLDGGAGSDTASYADAGSSVRIDLSIKTQQDTLGAGKDTLTNIENLIGSDYDDTLSGDAGANKIDAGAGDDVVDGGAGDDRLYGEAGNDWLNGGLGDDALYGGSGDDTLSGGLGDDLLDGGAGTDTANYADAASGVRVDLSLSSQQDTLGAGKDTLTDIENLIGSDYDDVLSGDAGANRIEAGAGDDVVDGGAGDDRLYGGSGDDSFSGGLGDDLLDGGAGTDTASYADAGSSVRIDLSLTSQQDTLGAGKDTLTDIENLIGSDYHDVLSGDAGANRIEAGAGDDVVDGGLGDDVLDGGAGNDTVSFERALAGVTASLAWGTAAGGAGNDTLRNFENLIGSAFADVLAGDGFANALFGGDGNDTLNGGGGDDRLSGGNGDDWLEGDAGDDELDGGAGVDTASYRHAGSAVEVNLALSGIQDTLGAGKDRLVSIENLEGSAFDDKLTGDDGNNTLSGGDGNDVLIGGLGNDVLDGGQGTDIADYSQALGSVTINLSLSGSQNTVSAGNDTLISIETVKGSAFADRLTGDGGNNSLYGMAGDDWLSGGDGDDALYGGDGTDTASYASSKQGVVVDLSLTTQQDTIGSGRDLLVDIENLEGSAFDDRLKGNDGNNLISGGAGNDSLSCGLGNDVLDGGDGNDTLLGGLGDDTLNGGAGSDTASYADIALGVTVDLNKQNIAQDTIGAGLDVLKSIENLIGSGADDILTGDGGDNQLDGGDGADKLYGGLGNDRLFGGAGDDTLVGGAGDDDMDGGAGADTADYSGTTGYVKVDLSITTGQNTVGAGNDRLINIENLIGTAGNDTLTGNGSDNTLNGGAGNDTISGGGGNDTIIGGAGDDRLDGGTGIDTVSYADATSKVTVSLQLQGASQATGGGGNDTLTGFENIIGSAFDDALTGDGNDNVISGGDGDDTVYFTGGNDTNYGGNGYDVLNFSKSTYGVTISMLSTNVWQALNVPNNAKMMISGFEHIVGSDYDDVLTGTIYWNVLNGGKGNDKLYGGDGGDTLIGGDGDDLLDGGNGPDTASYVDASAGVTVSLLIQGVGHSQDTIGAGKDTLVSIEGLYGSLFDDILTGDSANNTFTGDAGNDQLFGGGGDDTLIGGGGNDILDGGAGTDTASYSNFYAGVTVSLAITIQQNTINGGLDTLLNIENLLGTNYNDTLTGNAGDNVLSGSGGNDVLNGGLGNDTLDGGTGNDTASYSDATSGVTVDLTISGAQNTGAAGTDTLISIENLTGSNFADILRGDGSANILIGGLGDDQLFGGAGDDVLNGGGGNDTLDGGTGIDTATYVDATGGVTVDLTIAGAQNTVNSGMDTLTGIENLIGSGFADTLKGNALANILTGGLGDDFLFGGAGDDVLDGGSGLDTLSGGTGADKFQISNGQGTDTITDFSVAEADVIQFKAATFGLTSTSPIANYLVFGPVAPDAIHGYFIVTANGIAWDSDGTGTAAPVQLVLFSTAHPGLTASSFSFF